ncbi:glycosyltransferase family 25 protein [Enterobacter chuandaensis]|uniref:Glycosyltransferase family 25 protein n=1 Tax=Enterobacter chuandaensis TaxID=2497875 RepID=A0AA96RTT1_9ENTR|nr:glycosyltransferase family 25 protein [Enterobacter chuandaensis]WNS38331.1 glycosyltransferase family 25 protein [Enterobacter chuandaensis]
MKAYIINLESAKERKESVKAQAEHTGLRYEFIQAVDGRKIPVNLLSLLRKEHSYAVTPGEIGCSLSHLAAYKALASSNENCALVLEDDIFIPDNISQFLSELEKKITTNTPCVYLLSHVNHYNSKSIFDLPSNHKIHEVYNAAFTHAYVINRAAALVLLDKLFPVWCVADQWQTFREFGLIRLYGAIPEYIKTNPKYESTSTIGNREDISIQREKEIAWKFIYSNRSVKVRFMKSLDLIFHRPFQKIIKH